MAFLNGTGPDSTLFKTKSVYFATLFKTRDLYILLVSCVVSLFKTQDSENHTLLSGTYPLRPNKGVPPRGGAYSAYVICLKLKETFNLNILR